jgi:hypothetical protein
MNKTYRVKLQYIVYTDVTIDEDPSVEEYIFDEIFWEKATNQGYEQLMKGEFEVEPLQKVEVSSKSLYDLNNEGKL